MTNLNFQVTWCLSYLPRPIFVSRRVGVPMNEYQVNLGFVRQYDLEFSLQNRASTQSGITYYGKRNCRTDYYRCAAV